MKRKRVPQDPAHANGMRRRMHRNARLPLPDESRRVEDDEPEVAPLLPFHESLTKGVPDEQRDVSFRARTRRCGINRYVFLPEKPLRHFFKVDQKGPRIRQRAINLYFAADHRHGRSAR